MWLNLITIYTFQTHIDQNGYMFYKSASFRCASGQPRLYLDGDSDQTRHGPKASRINFIIADA